MPNQVLVIEPQNELKFKVDAEGTFEQGYSTYMRLTNPTNDTILFKIKTTAPKKYCVRPNSGVLSPNSKVEISVTPQPVCVDANDKHKHKFMVQSVISPEGKTNIEQVWKEISPEQLMDHKLKCVFEAPHDPNTNDSGDTSVDAPKNDNNKKRVAVEDTKPTAKPLPLAKSDDSDLQKLSSEVIQLREEESKLRLENLQLKEELLRLRTGGGDGNRVVRVHSYGPEKNVQGNMMPWMMIAVGMAVFGIIIGKFFM